MKEKEKFLLERARRLLKIPGNTRGENYLIALYVKKRYGKEAVLKLEKEISKILNQDFSFPKKRPGRWYPESYDVIAMLTAFYLFHWKEKDMFELGRFHAVHSFTIRILLKYFVSPQKFLKEAPDYWRRHFDFGSLEVADFDPKQKKVCLRVRGYQFDPIMCPFYAGYFYAIANSLFNTKDLKIKETKCYFRGDKYHEYLIQW